MVGPLQTTKRVADNFLFRRRENIISTTKNLVY